MDVKSLKMRNVGVVEVTRDAYNKKAPTLQVPYVPSPICWDKHLPWFLRGQVTQVVHEVPVEMNNRDP